MKRIHIIGRKNHGKTTLVVELVEQLTRRGLRVGTIKHTHHQHELDVPGKDSHRHRLAGATVVGVLSRSMNAVFMPTAETEIDSQRYANLEPAFAGCDLVVVEGDVQTAAPKIEVWRACHQTPPLAGEVAGVLALVTDDAPPLEVLTLPRVDIEGLAAWVEQTLQ